jgi:hypothetical protein
VRVVLDNDHAAGAVLHLDAGTGRVLARVRVGSGSGIAVGAHSVWAPRRFETPEHDGTIVPIDASRGRVVRRWRALAPSDGSGAGTLVADARGVRVLGTSRAEILRLQARRVVRRIPVDPTAQPLLARTPGGFRIAAGGGPSAATPRPPASSVSTPRRAG